MNINLDWNKDFQLGLTDKEIDVYFQPALTWSAGETKAIALFFLENNPSVTEGEDFKKLTQGLISWIWNASGEQQTANVSFSKFQDIYDQFLKTPFVLDDLIAFLEGNYIFEIQECMTSIKGVIFPMFPDLVLTIGEGTIPPIANMPRKGNKANQDIFSGQFLPLVNNTQEITSGEIKSARAFIFEDYGRLLMRTALQMILDYLEKRTTTEELTINTLFEEKFTPTDINKLAGMVSRFMMHGVRLDIEEESKVEKALYEATGQQFLLEDALDKDSYQFKLSTVNSSITPQAFAYTLSLTESGPKYPLLALAEGLTNLTEAPTAMSFDAKGIEALPFYKEEPRLFALRKWVKWTNAPQRAGLAATAQEFTFLQQVPQSLAVFLEKRNPNPTISLYKMDPSTRPKNLTASNFRVANTAYNWSTRINISINRIPNSTGTGYLSDTYELAGVSEAEINLLESLIAETNLLTNATIHLLYASDSGTTAPALKSLHAENKADFLLIRNNFSTNNLSSGSDGKTPALAAKMVDSTSHFLQLLWEGATIGNGGYFFHLPANSAEEVNLFESGETAQVTLLIEFESEDKDEIFDFHNNVIIKVGAADLLEKELVIAKIEDELDENDEETNKEKIPILNMPPGFWGFKFECPKLPKIKPRVAVERRSLRTLAATQLKETPLVAANTKRNVQSNESFEAIKVEAITIGEETENWVLVKTGETRGWIPTTQMIANPVKSTNELTLNALTRIFDAEENGTLIASLSKGNGPIEILDNKSEGIQIEFKIGTEDKTGWVAKDTKFIQTVFNLNNTSINAINTTNIEYNIEYAKIELPYLYQLLSFQVDGDENPNKLPIGPTIDKEAPEMWQYERLLPAFSMLPPNPPLENASVLTPIPDPERNPYNGIKNNGTDTLIAKFWWQDIYGNKLLGEVPEAATSGEEIPADEKHYTAKYTDQLIGINQWPSITESYQFLPTGKLEIDFSFSNVTYQGLMPGNAAARRLKANLDTYTRILYQMNQDDISLSVHTSLQDETDWKETFTVGTANDSESLLSFLLSIYRHLLKLYNALQALETFKETNETDILAVVTADIERLRLRSNLEEEIRKDLEKSIQTSFEAKVTAEIIATFNAQRKIIEKSLARKEDWEEKERAGVGLNAMRDNLIGTEEEIEKLEQELSQKVVAITNQLRNRVGAEPSLAEIIERMEADSNALNFVFFDFDKAFDRRITTELAAFKVEKLPKRLDIELENRFAKLKKEKIDAELMKRFKIANSTAAADILGLSILAPFSKSIDISSGGNPLTISRKFIQGLDVSITISRKPENIPEDVEPIDFTDPKYEEVHKSVAILSPKQTTDFIVNDPSLTLEGIVNLMNNNNPALSVTIEQIVDLNRDIAGIIKAGISFLLEDLGTGTVRVTVEQEEQPTGLKETSKAEDTLESLVDRIRRKIEAAPRAEGLDTPDVKLSLLDFVGQIKNTSGIIRSGAVLTTEAPNLRNFAENFSKTFFGYQLAISEERNNTQTTNTGNGRTQPGPSQFLFVVNLGTNGISYDILDQNPNIYAIPPISTTLFTGTVSIQNKNGVSSQKEVSALDMNLLARNFLVTLEDFLKPETLIPAHTADAVSVQKILHNKYLLADKISKTTTLVLDKKASTTPEETEAVIAKRSLEAQQAIRHKLRLNLVEGYDIESIVQFNATINDTIGATDETFEPRLSGSVKVVGISLGADPNDTETVPPKDIDHLITPGYFELAGDATNSTASFTYLFDTKTPEKFGNINLELEFEPLEIAYNLEEIHSEFLASDKLRFILPKQLNVYQVTAENIAALNITESAVQIKSSLRTLIGESYFSLTEFENAIKELSGVVEAQYEQFRDELLQSANPNYMGKSAVPIPLRYYPQSPSLIFQRAESDDSSLEDINDLREWEYKIVYEHQDVAQDSIDCIVRLNGTKDEFGKEPIIIFNSEEEAITAANTGIAIAQRQKSIAEQANNAVDGKVGSTAKTNEALKARAAVAVAITAAAKAKAAAKFLAIKSSAANFLAINNLAGDTEEEIAEKMLIAEIAEAAATKAATEAENAKLAVAGTKLAATQAAQKVDNLFDALINFEEVASFFTTEFDALRKGKTSTEQTKALALFATLSTLVVENWGSVSIYNHSAHYQPEEGDLHFEINEEPLSGEDAAVVEREATITSKTKITTRTGEKPLVPLLDLPGFFRHTTINLSKVDTWKFTYQEGNLTNADGKPVDPDGNLINEDGYLINEAGALIDGEGNLINENGYLINEAGALIDGKGNLINEAGALIDGAGNLINEAGALIDEAGNLINEAGALIDEAGNLINEDDATGKVITNNGTVTKPKKFQPKFAFDPHDYGDSSIPDRVFRIENLDILKYQNAAASIWLSRNKNLVFERTTNDAFVFQTPAVSFANPAVPFITNDEPFDIALLKPATGVPQRRTLQEHLVKLLDLLEPSVSPPDLLPEDYRYEVRLSCRFAFSLASAKGLNDDLVSTLPLLIGLRLEPLDDLNAEHQSQTLLKYPEKLHKEISTWFQTNRPAEENAYLLFTLDIFSKLDPNENSSLPMLRVRRMELKLADISDMAAVSGKEI